ncbi:unnamed protein product [Dicrocoelium dendriticum]|nr:unnamed protein product [Dicrocoelium dendriticum]
MYNGIGLPTPRGSGTNGYVQRNLAFINNIKEKPSYKTDDDVKRADAAFFKEPNKEILEHEKKRKIEVKCFEMEQIMEDQGYTQSEIAKKVSAYRSKLLEELRNEPPKQPHLQVDPTETIEKETGRLVPKGTHETAAVNILKNTVFKEALGIGSDFQDGNSMEQSKLRRQEEMEKKKLLEVQKTLKYHTSTSHNVTRRIQMYLWFWAPTKKQQSLVPDFKISGPYSM